MEIPLTLLYKTYISIRNCSVPLPFQISQYLCHLHLLTKRLYKVKDKSQAKTNQHLSFSDPHTPLFTTRQGRIAYLFFLL